MAFETACSIPPFLLQEFCLRSHLVLRPFFLLRFFRSHISDRLAQKEKPTARIETSAIEALLVEGRTDWRRGEIMFPLADIAPDIGISDVLADTVQYKDLTVNVRETS